MVKSRCYQSLHHKWITCVKTTSMSYEKDTITDEVGFILGIRFGDEADCALLMLVGPSVDIKMS